MWNRKNLKKNGKKNLKKNYWRILGISLLVAFIASGMKVTHQVDNAAMYFVGGRFDLPSNAQIVNDWYFSIRESDAPQNNQVLEFLGEHYTPKKGALAHIYNRMTEEKSALYGFINAMNDFIFKDKATEGMIILAGVFLMILFLALVSNVLAVGQCRFLLENRTYRQSKMGRLAFPWRVKRWKANAFTMFERSFLIFLWDLTIIGGIIKRYSYKMIPYILAENPDIGHKEAFALSKRMMKGNKMRGFLLDFSFLGWRILSAFTLGILGYVWIKPYTETVWAEVYAALRQEALEQGYSGAEYLNDKLLFEESDAEEYPVELYPLYNPETKTWIRINYRRKYTVCSLILMFFSFSVIGWLWEVSLHLFGDGIVEYTAGFILWETKHMYWWNYSGYFLNLHGRICAEGLIVFGLGGCAFIYIIAPFFDEIFKKIPRRAAIILCVILLSVFAADSVYSAVYPNSGAGITDYENHG